MTQIDTDKLTALDEAATPGPWEQESGYLGDDPYCAIYVTNADGEPQGIAEVNDSIEAGQANAELLTLLRNSVPAILAMAEENRRLREALERCAKIVERNNHRQNEKVDDVVVIARQALAAPGDRG